MSYRPADLLAEIRAATTTFAEPGAIVARLAGPCGRLARESDWLEPRFFAADPQRGFGIVSLHEEADHSLSIVVAALLPGRALPPHNHGTWALQAGLTGIQTSIAWQRLDDGRQPGHAEIVARERLVLRPGDVATFLPADIHSVVNEGSEVALSLNLYGLSYVAAGASRFDPATETERPLLS